MFSILLRRTHMYLALFLAPWVVMYAISTIVMNHHHSTPPQFDKVSEQTHDGAFPENATPQVMASQILASLNLDGAHNVPKPAPDGKLTIQRQDIVAPYRITYTPGNRKLTVERAKFRATNFMHSIHRRRGYQHSYALDDAWGVTVDLFIVACIVWALTGLWMWWEMKLTRAYGALSLVIGATLFVFFLVTL